MRSNRKGVSTVLVSALLIVTIIVVAMFGYYIYSQMWAPKPPTEPFYGTAQIKLTASNSFDQSDVTETSPTYKAFHTDGQDFDSMVKADFSAGVSLTADTATDMDVTIDDVGYEALWIYAGTAHFLDLEETAASNSRIKGSRTDLDINADGKRDTLLSLYLGDVAEPGANIKPVVTIDLKMVPDETADLTINSPADKTMGTGTKTGTVEWQIAGFEEKKGWTLSRVYIVQNRTDQDYVKVTGVSIGYEVGAFPESSLTYETGAKRWSVDIDVENYRAVQDCILIKRPIAGTSYCSFTVSIETYFTTGNYAVTLTLYVEAINPSGTITTKSDVVNLDDA